MAFKLPYRVGCDDAGGNCVIEETVYACSESEANAMLERKDWRVCRNFAETKHLCPDHARYGSVE